jgi:hypothetical protein
MGGTSERGVENSLVGEMELSEGNARGLRISEEAKESAEEGPDGRSGVVKSFWTLVTSVKSAGKIVPATHASALADKIQNMNMV